MAAISIDAGRARAAHVDRRDMVVEVGVSAMRYELHFIGEGGKLLATDCVDAENDCGAVEAARRKYNGVRLRYELRQGARYICSDASIPARPSSIVGHA
jgi:hypothetical protein